MKHTAGPNKQGLSALSRFAIPKGSEVPALSPHLVADYEAAVAREHFDYDFDSKPTSARSRTPKGSSRLQ